MIATVIHVRHAAPLAAALFLLAQALPAGQVSSDNWVGATGRYQCSANVQDNSEMTWIRHSLTTRMDTATIRAINNAVVPTSIYVRSELSDETIYTDVVFRDADHVGAYCGGAWHPSPGGWVGYTYCQKLTGARCDRFRIDYDTLPDRR